MACGRCGLLILSQNVATKLLWRSVDEQRSLLRHVSRSLQTSTSMCKIFEVPSEREADSLKKVYPNPKSLIHDLLEPLVSSGVTAMPRVAVAPRLGGQYWRTKLQLHWPSKATVAAVHSSVAGAQENVYLLACDLLKVSVVMSAYTGIVSP
ncbi:hypothetical protein ACOMHN_003467 [Nucella lapillus]